VSVRDAINRSVGRCGADGTVSRGGDGRGGFPGGGNPGSVRDRPGVEPCSGLDPSGNLSVDFIMSALTWGLVVGLAVALFSVE